MIRLLVSVTHLLGLAEFVLLDPATHLFRPASPARDASTIDVTRGGDSPEVLSGDSPEVLGSGIFIFVPSKYFNHVTIQQSGVWIQSSEVYSKQ